MTLLACFKREVLVAKSTKANSERVRIDAKRGVNRERVKVELEAARERLAESRFRNSCWASDASHEEHDGSGVEEGFCRGD